MQKLVIARWRTLLTTVETFAIGLMGATVLEHVQIGLRVTNKLMTINSDGSKAGKAEPWAYV